MTEQIIKSGVFIGRMQPPHPGHLSIIVTMIQECTNNLILLGSSLASRDIKNPFTWRDRAELIILSLRKYESDKTFYISTISRHETNYHISFSNGAWLDICPLKDYPYSDSKWQYEVQRNAEESFTHLALTQNEIVLYGNDKDDSSYYLELFPKWKRRATVAEGAEITNYHSTDIRVDLLSGFHLMSKKYQLNPNVRGWLLQWRGTKEGERLCKEFRWIENYKDMYSELPYGIIFQTVDCLITWRGLILLGMRKSMPGKGLWALPGGYVNQNEKIRDAAVRELIEETRTKVYMNTKNGYKRLRFDPSWIAGKETFDHPNRSKRGRIITTAFHWKIPDHYEIVHEAADDLQKTQFFPINEVLDNMHYDLFEDHQAIIEGMLLNH